MNRMAYDKDDKDGRAYVDARRIVAENNIRSLRMALDSAEEYAVNSRVDCDSEGKMVAFNADGWNMVKYDVMLEEMEMIRSRMMDGIVNNPE